MSLSVLVEESEAGGGGGGRVAPAMGTGGDGEVEASSGFAIRRPPSVWERLMSPFMAAVCRGGDARWCSRFGGDVDERYSICSAAAWQGPSLQCTLLGAYDVLRTPGCCASA